MLKKSILFLTFASLLLAQTSQIHSFWWRKKPAPKNKNMQIRVVAGVMSFLTLTLSVLKVLATSKLSKRIVQRPPQSTKTNISFEKDFAPGTIPQNIKEIRESFRYLGLEETPRTILLYGPTSTGKTHTAKALARDLGATKYIEITGPEFRKPLEGLSPLLIQRIFRQALAISKKTKRPGVIIINEIDGGTSNISNPLSNGQSRVIAQTLQGLLDRDEYKNIFVIATSNFVRKNDIPRPLIERFQEHIRVDLPNQDQRKSLINFYAQKYNLDLGGQDFSRQTKGFNVRRLQGWVKKLRNKSLKEEFKRHLIKQKNKKNLQPKNECKSFFKKIIDKLRCIKKEIVNAFKKSWKKTHEKLFNNKKKKLVKKQEPKIKIPKEMAQEELNKIIESNINLSDRKNNKEIAKIRHLIKISQLISNQKNKPKKIQKTKKRSSSLPLSKN